MKLRNVIAYLAPGLRAPQICEACGKPFVCGASLAACWCTDVKLTDAQRTALRAKYQRCLCRECLEHVARIPAEHAPT